MDFWSRLIGGSRALPNKSSKATSPTERLTAFKRACNALQQIWRATNNPSGEQSVAHARTYVERLNSILSEEARGPAPHPCVAYAASSQVFVTVTKLALSFYDEGVIRSATVFFNTLIDAEVDGVVDNRLFARAMVDLVRRAEKTSDEIEGRLVELLFGIANNIRLQPVILPAWFVPRVTPAAQDSDSQAPSGTEFAGATRKDEFPLFYLLVDYVHHEGRAGDFARTGLLYLIETASRSKNLEKWLIESDLATLMATGLGALYSQLGHLSFTLTDEDENVPHIIVLSDHAKEETALQPTLGQTMDAFMSYLLFWQDTIDHCKSAEVNDTLLDHFQVLFLEQLLYPSLLESSDVAGGSTAAVLTYMCRILDSIDQGELVHRILHFLLASSPRPEEQMDMSASRRKSLNVLAALASEAAQPSPSLFNLRDLALLGLQSSNCQTVLATLRLLNTVLQRHHLFARALIHTIPTQPAHQRPVGALNAELEQLLVMGTSLVDDPTLNESYDNYVADATCVLESRLCLPISSMKEDEETLPLPLPLQQDDPIVQALFTCFESFFTNSVIVNLALTGVFMSLASSHLFSLDGWVLVDPNQYEAPSSEEIDDEFEHVRRAYQAPTWPATAAPTLTLALQKLVNQVRQWQRELPDFDVLLAARRELLHQEDRPQTPDRSREPSEPPVSLTNRSRPSYHGSPDASALSSRGRSPYPVYSPPMFPSRDRDGSSVPSDSRGSLNTRAVAAEALRQRLSMPFPPAPSNPQSPSAEEGASDSADTKDGPVATLGHVLTNVVILYEFILELSAVVQVRGSLFEEAGYDSN
ncbi:Major facilitator superfamily domain general substrate transporter [Penicillium cf. griseofulvum]|uniref:Major facilitator superfamily domain general substrate transporter n=1 Tax=Penicillium cf. griseofulvum TaxID=2972120 RepID=A0A9W9M525_9EURO|nr:Major facilitator superfamily domain general substrate transporter [Penicillium cf. griseofulvum]KAJ5434783.1 Major facilitator superfamily domain general substrate transporter [Penicillium cf. griseofulvum]KAJ5452615.1 Major facilitator superfamily domain general substrate transporter [Penicillium cf. griseofulvum]